MALLERGSFLDALDTYADDMRSGSGRCVLLSGEAGIGKTSLLTAFRSARSDVRWLWAACDGGFTPQPLGPLYEIAHAVGDPLRAAITNADRRAAFSAFLDELDAGGPTVAVVEDVHWADDATLDWLRFLARRLVTRRALIVASYRDDEQSALRSVLADIAMQPCTRRMTLPALSQQAVRAMAGRDDVAELYRLTGGVPFYLDEVLHGDPGTIPPTVADLVAARVAALSPDARNLLDAAAILARPCPGEVIGQVAGSVPDALDECAASGALLHGADGFGYRHEITRLAVRAAIGPQRAAALHRRALDALEATGADAAELAHHAEAAGERARAFRYAVAAAAGAGALRSNREAAVQYGRALRFAEQATVRERAELHAGLAASLASVDRWEEATASCEQALALWREVGDRDKISDTLRMLSTCYWRLCRGADCVATAHAMMDLMRDGEDSPARGWAFAHFANATASAQDCQEAVRIARAVGDAELEANALDTLGAIRVDRGEDGLTELRAALQIACRDDLEKEAARAYANLYQAAVDVYEIVEHAGVYADGVAFCREHDLTTYGYCLRGAHAGALVRLGRYREAIEIVTQLLDQPISPVNRLSLLLPLGLAQVRSGDTGSVATLADAATLAITTDEPRWRLLLAIAQAQRAWLHGEPVDPAWTDLALETQADQAWLHAELVLWLDRLGVRVETAARLPEPFRLEAAGQYEAAARWWASASCPFEEAMSLAASGTESALRVALDRLTSLGAEAAAAQVRRRLRSIGANAIPSGPRPTTRAHPNGLTARQGEVLRLVQQGLSNSAIAARLVISERTTEHHVAAILAKFGVASRTELLARR